MPRAVHLVAEGWLVKTTSGKISREANLRRLAALPSQCRGAAVGEGGAGC